MVAKLVDNPEVLLGLVTSMVLVPVRDFSSVDNVESAWYLSGSELLNLSERQVVSCDSVDLGCGGGDMQTAFEYVMSAPVDGLVSGLVHSYYRSTWKTALQPSPGMCRSPRVRWESH